MLWRPQSKQSLLQLPLSLSKMVWHGARRSGAKKPKGLDFVGRSAGRRGGVRYWIKIPRFLRIYDPIMTSARVQLGFPLSGRDGGLEGRIGEARARPFVFCAGESERAEFDRNSLIDGSDLDLNWLFSAPITGWRWGKCARHPISAENKSHLIRKSDADESREWRLEWIGAFFMALSCHRAVGRHIKSNFPGPNDATPVANCDSMAASALPPSRR